MKIMYLDFEWLIKAIYNLDKVRTEEKIRLLQSKPYSIKNALSIASEIVSYYSRCVERKILLPLEIKL